MPNRAWTVVDPSSQTRYAVLNRTFSDHTTFLAVSSITQAATLTGAYMPNAILTDANLYAVNAPGLHFYGSNAKLDGSVALDFANLANANLGTANLEGALLYGADLSYASLINARLKNAALVAAASGSRPRSPTRSSTAPTSPTLISRGRPVQCRSLRCKRRLSVRGRLRGGAGDRQ